MNNGIKIVGAFFIVALAGFSSCKTKKDAEINIDRTESTEKNGNDVAIDNAAFEWFDGKFNADVVNNGKSNSFKGRVRMRRDSLIWIQIKPDVAIIEVFRVLISPDSVQFINYLNKEYFAGDFTYIRSAIKYDVSFGMVQSIFAGNPHLMFNLDQYKVSIDKTDQVLSSSDINAYAEAKKAKRPIASPFQAIWVNSQKKTWRNTVYDPNNRMELDIRYTEYQQLDSALFPKSGALTIIGDTVNTYFTFTFTKTDIGVPFDFPFSIPDSYKRIRI